MAVHLRHYSSDCAKIFALSMGELFCIRKKTRTNRKFAEVSESEFGIENCSYRSNPIKLQMSPYDIRTNVNLINLAIFGPKPTNFKPSKVVQNM